MTLHRISKTAIKVNRDAFHLIESESAIHSFKFPRFSIFLAWPTCSLQYLLGSIQSNIGWRCFSGRTCKLPVTSIRGIPADAWVMISIAGVLVGSCRSFGILALGSFWHVRCRLLLAPRLPLESLNLQILNSLYILRL